jgi:integrase/recombinase XerD
MTSNTFNDKEIEQVMDYIDNSQRNSLRDRAIVHLSLKAGMRNGDIANLKVGDVINDQGVIRDIIEVDRQVVLFNSQVKTDLANYLEERFHRSLDDIPHLNHQLSGHIYNLHLFANRKRGYFDHWTLPAYLRNLYIRAGMKNKSGASARATYIKKISKSGLSLNQMTRLTGVPPDTIARLITSNTEINEREVIEQM